jgi:hypothetical protein
VRPQNATNRRWISLAREDEMCDPVDSLIRSIADRRSLGRSGLRVGGAVVRTKVVNELVSVFIDDETEAMAMCWANAVCVPRSPTRIMGKAHCKVLNVLLEALSIRNVRSGYQCSVRRPRRHGEEPRLGLFSCNRATGVDVLQLALECFVCLKYPGCVLYYSPICEYSSDTVCLDEDGYPDRRYAALYANCLSPVAAVDSAYRTTAANETWFPDWSVPYAQPRGLATGWRRRQDDWPN